MPVTDYRHGNKRKHIPPAGLAAQGEIKEAPKLQFAYNPHLPPVLRFDSDAAVEKLIAKLERGEKLTEEERAALATALRDHEPWLEWSGKREKKGFEVEPVALHIHERISAQAILKVAARQDVQRDLFADPQLEYQIAVQFYEHDVDWANRMILGDSLQVMASLARREGLAGKVQMIYLDPPYGIKFASNFQPEIGRRDVKDKETDLTREPEMVKAYRDTWTLGVHSYLSYLRDRLILCRELLADSGSIFVQIGDENLHRVRAVMDEVFGNNNFVALITFQTSVPLGATYVPGVCNYVLMYAKNRKQLKFRRVFREKPVGEGSAYNAYQLSTGEIRNMRIPESSGDITLPEGAAPFFNLSMLSAGTTPSCVYSMEAFGRIFSPGGGRSWKTNRVGFSRIVKAERIFPTESTLRYILFHSDYSVAELTDLWEDAGSVQDKAYVVQTSTKVIERCLLMTTDPGDLVLDPTCGSGTTAYVAEQWGRRWITIDTSRVALALARQRLLTARFDYYKLRRSDVPVASPSPSGSSRSDVPVASSSGVRVTSPSGVDAASTPSGGDAASTDSSGEDAASASASSPSGKKSGGDAASTPSLRSYFDPERPIGFVRGGNLPHWRQEGVTYFVTWRTADSMPRERVEQWQREREEWLAKHPEPHSKSEKAEYDRLFPERWEMWLDECHGECLLARPELKAVVESALRHFDSQRYRLDEFVVMPNHVHVLVTPLEAHRLSEIVQNWKSYTAHEINRRLGRSGLFWQKESFDHIVRSADEMERIRRYIRDNPKLLVEAKSSSLSANTSLSANARPNAAWPLYSSSGASGGDALDNSSNSSNSSGEDAASTISSPSQGFVYKTVPHITLRSIAQNVALDAIFAKHQPVLDEKLKALNDALRLVTPELRQKLRSKLLEKEKREGKKAVTDADRRRWLLPPQNRAKDAYTTVPNDLAGWHEWEVPFDTDTDWPAPLQEALRAYRAAWRAKMDEINACIAANAEQEELVDKPEIVRGIVRVSGPFTMEAVMPIEESLAGETPIGGEPEELETFGHVEAASIPLGISDGDVASINAGAYLDNMLRLLRADGVRFPNNKVAKFSRLEPLSGTEFLHAEGEWTAENGKERRVAVSFGPQFGAVTAYQVENALRQAHRRGYDDLVFAGFSFDAAAQAVIQEDPNPKVRCHLAHIRPDVNMGDLLKTTPGSQIFTVFGMPRTKLIGPDSDGLYRIEMEGVDIYDPVNNVLLPTNADKVAAWFLDSDYDGRTFCITQAFFPDKSAWEKLARALKGVVDEAAFAALSGTVSLPFAAGQHKRAAVKVIDPRGNEVMAVRILSKEKGYMNQC